MILTPELILNLAKKIPGARLDNLRYASDAVLRKYMSLPFSALQNDLQVTDTCITIIAGIGSLICTVDKFEFNSEPKQINVRNKLEVPENISNARYSICLACERYNKNTDKCGTCGCGTEMKIQSKSLVFKCPNSKWPLEGI